VQWEEGIWESASGTDASSLRYHNLPGIDGFAELGEKARSAALAVAHLESCSCGCLDHSVAFCLNEDTNCLTVRERARHIVEEAARRFPPPVEEPVEQPGEVPEEAAPAEPAEQTGNESLEGPAVEPGQEKEERGES
jgi:hypothetical protein